jgi:hypothetical protein
VVHLSRRIALSPLNKGFLLFQSLLSSLPYLSFISPVGSKYPRLSIAISALCDGGMMERYGRDKNYLSRAGSLLYKGFPNDDGRDERFFSKK